MIEVEEIDEIKEVEEAEVVLSYGKMPNVAPTIKFISDEESYSKDKYVNGDLLDEFNEFENYEDY